MQCLKIQPTSPDRLSLVGDGHQPQFAYARRSSSASSAEPGSADEAHLPHAWTMESFSRKKLDRQEKSYVVAATVRYLTRQIVGGARHFCGLGLVIRCGSSVLNRAVSNISLKLDELLALNAKVNILIVKTVFGGERPRYEEKSNGL